MSDKEKYPDIYVVISHLKEQYCYATREPEFLLGGVQKLRDALDRQDAINPLELYDIANIVYAWDKSHPFLDLGAQGASALFCGTNLADDPKTRNPARYNVPTFMADFYQKTRSHSVVSDYNKNHGHRRDLIGYILKMQDSLRIDPYIYSHAQDSIHLDRLYNHSHDGKLHDSGRISLAIKTHGSPENTSRFTHLNSVLSIIEKSLNQDGLRRIAKGVVEYYDSACKQLASLQDGKAIGPVIEECMEAAVLAHAERLERQNAQGGDRFSLQCLADSAISVEAIQYMNQQQRS